ncbi:MAG: hypothetical protein AB7S41_03115 [Parvibaculaceae bacterium]
MTAAAGQPRNPYLVLAAAVVLPGAGQLLNGQAPRALQFLFFIVVLGWVSSHLAPPGVSFLGRYAGGIFIYAMAVYDAYRTARIRWEVWRHRQAEEGGPPGQP